METQVAVTDMGLRKPTSIAIVSGKGGSGKTLVTAAMARVMDATGLTTLIVDADIGTGGMTYYLGVKLVRNTATGLSELGYCSAQDELVDSILQKGRQQVFSFKQVMLFGVGDHRRFYRRAGTESTDEPLRNAIKLLLDRNSLARTFSWILIDCRGGVDEHTLSVCGVADQVLLVVEPDVTSFQATQHLVEVLSENDLAHKLCGFVINKVVDDPAVIARNGTSVFKSQYLSSIPFDFQAMRAFLIGEVPTAGSLFGVHVWEAMSKAFPDDVGRPPGRVWTFRDFSRVGVADPDSSAGSAVAAALIVFAAFMLALYSVLGRAVPPSLAVVGIASLALAGLVGTVEMYRRLLGRVFRAYLGLLDRALPRRRDN